MTKTSGAPGMERSGSTFTRPTRSSGTPSDRAIGDGATPAAQMTVRERIRRPPATTPSASTAVTGVPTRTSQPIRRKRAAAFSESSGA